MPYSVVVKFCIRIQAWHCTDIRIESIGEGLSKILFYWVWEGVKIMRALGSIALEFGEGPQNVQTKGQSGPWNVDLYQFLIYHVYIKISENQIWPLKIYEALSFFFSLGKSQMALEIYYLPLGVSISIRWKSASIQFQLVSIIIVFHHIFH